MGIIAIISERYSYAYARPMLRLCYSLPCPFHLPRNEDTQRSTFFANKSQIFPPIHRNMEDFLYIRSKFRKIDFVDVPFARQNSCKHGCVLTYPEYW